MPARAQNVDYSPESPGAGSIAYDPSRDEMVGVMNLWPEDTGAEGVIFISTSMAAHGPRVKWWPTRPNTDGPCLVVVLEDPPRAINLGLPPRDAWRGASEAVAWATLNRDALLEYWFEGNLWGRAKFTAFLDGLRKLP